MYASAVILTSHRVLIAKENRQISLDPRAGDLQAASRAMDLNWMGWDERVAAVRDCKALRDEGSSVRISGFLWPASAGSTVTVFITFEPLAIHSFK